MHHHDDDKSLHVPTVGYLLVIFSDDVHHINTHIFNNTVVSDCTHYIIILINFKFDMMMFERLRYTRTVLVLHSSDYSQMHYILSYLNVCHLKLSYYTVVKSYGKCFVLVLEVCFARASCSVRPSVTLSRFATIYALAAILPKTFKFKKKSVSRINMTERNRSEFGRWRIYGCSQKSFLIDVRQARSGTF